MKTATFIRTLSGFTGTAELYKLDPPMVETRYDSRYGTKIEASYEYVVVSAAFIPFSGPETYIFPANEHGDITSWLERDGSFKGDTDIPQALQNAGYEISNQLV